MVMKYAGNYIIINIKNNKCYIGEDIDLGKRIKQHEIALKNNKHENKHLQNAWNKYGFESFKFKTFEKMFSYNENNKEEKKKAQYNAFEEEKYLIQEYKSFDPNFGYNKTYGGDGGLLTEEIIQKLKESSKGENNGMFGITGSLHPLYGRTGENAVFYGKKHSEETKKKMGISRKEYINKNDITFSHENHPRCKLSWKDIKEIRKIIKNKTFTQRKIAEIYNIHYKYVNRIIKNKVWKEEDYKVDNVEAFKQWIPSWDNE